ncbi:TPA: hypothetical protein DCL37_03355 [Candidatus Acetothermia bacterium]|nr:hypothetical protein [Candidatus Acetothermia bacterium]
MVVKAKVAVLVCGFLALGGMALAGGEQVREFVVGDRAIGWFTNLTGAAVGGFHVEFDQAVTILYKVEIGGLVESATGASEGAEFDFAGELVPYGLVELDWQPATAKVTLFQWFSDGKPVGSPYYATLPAFFKVLVQGLVALRERSPDQFTALLQGFFEVNPDLVATLADAGIPTDMLISSLLTAPTEGIMNLLSTLVEGFGIKTLEDFQAALDLEPLLQGLGL